MSSPTPEERDPQLVSALEQAVRGHSKKHYQAGLSAGLCLAIKELNSTLSSSDHKKYSEVLTRLAVLAVEARTNSLDPKPVPR
jgi:hypothetical protein